MISQQTLLRLSAEHLHAVWNEQQHSNTRCLVLFINACGDDSEPEIMWRTFSQVGAHRNIWREEKHKKRTTPLFHTSRLSCDFNDFIQSEVWTSHTHTHTHWRSPPFSRLDEEPQRWEDDNWSPGTFTHCSWAFVPGTFFWPPDSSAANEAEPSAID